MEMRRAGRSVIRPATRLAQVVAAFSLLASAATGTPRWAPRPMPRRNETALDAYVAKPDPAYRFTRASVIAGEGYTAHVLDLVSQQWRNPWEVDRTEWRHWLTIIVPDRVRHSTALLWIGGGDNDDPAPLASVGSIGAPRAVDRERGRRSRHGSQPAALLRRFAEGARVEDDLIGYARVKYIVTGDVEWLVRLAMVKSARASDGRGAGVPARRRWRASRDR